MSSAMSSAKSPAQTSKAARPSFGLSGTSNSSLLLERTKGLVRRATPDSEALASSDDEPEKPYAHPSPSILHPVKPPRRSSWLSDIQPPPGRRGSAAATAVAAPGSVSPRSVQPHPPMPDPLTWATTPAVPPPRPYPVTTTAAAAFPWSSGIWTSDVRREPPARLAEVLPSPTSEAPPLAAHHHDARETVAVGTIPFPIPLHPTPKSYRSQSYSVGQLELESPGSTGAHPAAAAAYLPHRGKVGPPLALKPRPSRASLRGELAHDGPALGQLREADDDEQLEAEDDVGPRARAAADA
ncbi:MAG: hypothetical protein M1826_002049, partial [Phylliscum demangeonii]